MSGQRGLVPSNFVEKVADESEMNRMMNGTGEGIGRRNVCYGCDKFLFSHEVEQCYAL